MHVVDACFQPLPLTTTQNEVCLAYARNKRLVGETKCEEGGPVDICRDQRID